MKNFTLFNLLSVILFVSLSSSLSSHGMSLNDLTILLPLPQKSEMHTLLSPMDQGARGPLLAKGIVLNLPQLVPETSNQALWQESLKVVGIRIDPCFIEGVGPRACRSQIRLVWQPVIHIGTSPSTRDAALHSFYNFSDQQFDRILRDWQRLYSGTMRDPLQVQPRIVSEGLQGEYWTYLRSLILQHCGEQNLARITFMNVMAGEQLWIFSGFDIKDGQITELSIPRIDKPSQGVIQGSSHVHQFTGAMLPSPQVDRDFVKLTEDSVSVQKTFSEPEIKELVGKVLEYEHPERHNPGTLDCASCHLANMAHQWSLKNLKHNDWKKEFGSFSYQSSYNLENTTKGPLRTNQLRALGYFMGWPVLSQRVINETAAVAEILSRQ